VTRAFQVEEGGGVIGVFELEPGTEIDRHHRGSGGQVGFHSGVNRPGGELGAVAHTDAGAIFTGIPLRTALPETWSTLPSLRRLTLTPAWAAATAIREPGCP
jgi:hypothetical protein